MLNNYYNLNLQSKGAKFSKIKPDWAKKRSQQAGFLIDSYFFMLQNMIMVISFRLERRLVSDFLQYC